MHRIFAYFLITPGNQSASRQRQEIASRYQVDEWFSDQVALARTTASQRPGFGRLMRGMEERDVLVVPSIDRLGRDTIDVTETIQELTLRGVIVISIREGFDLGMPSGNAMLKLLSAMASLEGLNAKERRAGEIARSRAEYRRMGRLKRINDDEVAGWRFENDATIQQTAEHFDISTASVKRACRKPKAAPPDDDLRMRMAM